MDFLHIHLMINHFPVVLYIVAGVFLATGLWTRDKGSLNRAMVLIFMASFMGILSYYSGENAEDAAEAFLANSETFIESHEEQAGVSLVFLGLSLLASGLALAAKRWVNTSLFRAGVFISPLVLLTFGSLILTGSTGGKIRHSELRDDFKAPIYMESYEKNKDEEEKHDD